MNEFQDYDIKYPDLLLEIVEFFKVQSGQAPRGNIQDFCNVYKAKSGDNLDPYIVGKLCDRLTEMGQMVLIQRGKIYCLLDIYCSFAVQVDQFKNIPDIYRHKLNCYVYGFDYIYKVYKETTLPIVVKTAKGDDSMGSCFRIRNGLATARHCLTDGTPVAIKGYTKAQLDGFKVYVSKDENVDLAFIETEDVLFPYEDIPNVLDDVLVMGYPKVPFFLNFCTGEKANISAEAELRLTPTMGSVAADGEMYTFTGIKNVLLITARIRGGNSGGPVINKKGAVVAVATGVPAGEGLSDDNVGYGMAYPIKALDDMIKEGNTVKFEFRDFPNY